MTFLVDYNLDGYAFVFLGILAKLGWLEILSIQFVTFREVGLSMESSDRMVWQYAQANQMMILSTCSGITLTTLVRAKSAHRLNSRSFGLTVDKKVVKVIS